jgi:hypothetical protein
MAKRREARSGGGGVLERCSVDLVSATSDDFFPRKRCERSHRLIIGRRTKHHGVLRLCGDARGAAYTRE